MEWTRDLKRKRCCRENGARIRIGAPAWIGGRSRYAMTRKVRERRWQDAAGAGRLTPDRRLSTGGARQVCSSRGQSCIAAACNWSPGRIAALGQAETVQHVSGDSSFLQQQTWLRKGGLRRGATDHAWSKR